jgi:hypothetical protein
LQIFVKNLFQLFLTASLCIFANGCATASPTNSTKNIRAQYVVTVTDDFIVDVYQNGVRVPDEKRELVAEVFGATAERIHIQVQKGDWLVFNVVSDRMRWGGVRTFMAAGVLATNKFGFSTSLSSKNWSVCDDLDSAHRFIAEKNYFQDHRPMPIEQPWQDGPKYMKQFAGNEWSGDPIWGWSPNTWIKVIVK